MADGGIGYSGASTDEVSIFVVADVAIYRDGLRAYFDRQPGCVVAGCAQALGDVAGADVRVIIVDCSSRAPAAILAAHGLLESTGAAVVVIGIPTNLNIMLTYIEAGAAACIGRDDSLATLHETVMKAASKESCISGVLADAVLTRLQERAFSDHLATLTYHDLTRRERQVAELMGQHLSNKQIAFELHISLNTVKNHVHQVIQKLAISRRSEADHVLSRLPAVV